MPEYLAPGVYVEETSYRSKSIEGVATTVTGFVGPCRYGPVDQVPEIVTSLADFERVYGNGEELNFTDEGKTANFLWHAVRAFFEEGGNKLYVSRIENGAVQASCTLLSGSPLNAALSFKARYPGESGTMRITLTLKMGQNILANEKGSTVVRSLHHRDVVWIGDATSPITSPPGTGSFYLATFDQNLQKWTFECSNGESLYLGSAGEGEYNLNASNGDQLHIVTLDIALLDPKTDRPSQVWSDLALDPEHTNKAGRSDSLFEAFSCDSKPSLRGIPIIVEALDQSSTPQPADISGLDLLAILQEYDENITVTPESTSTMKASTTILLDNGSDGARPESAEYTGETDDIDGPKTGLKAFEDIEDISIVAAPGSTFGLSNGYEDDAKSIMSALIAHAERMRYRIAVLDSGDGQSITQIQALRAQFDSKHAALYYPWIRIMDPITRKELLLPPSGFVAGIYARNDIERAVYKAPANEVVRLALGFETTLNKAQQEVLNPEGINCFRFFEGRGYRLWGARTISSDPEWKYVNLRRYFAFLERSIDKGTQWAVFEPNGEALWANVRRTIYDFLLNEWMQGALLGEKPEQAFFVRCDRSTMTQNDLDNGRLICKIGVAPLRPAEFVIFRIGQWTADRKM